MTTTILHYLLFYLSILKCVHISYTLVRLLLDFKKESLHVVILTALWLSLLGTSTYWGSELFHRGLQEMIILFNYLKFEPTECKKHGIRSGRSIRAFKSKTVWAKVTGHLLLSLNLQELLCVATPFVTKLFAPLYIVMMWAFPNRNIFATSLICNYEGNLRSLDYVLIVVIEILTAFLHGIQYSVPLLFPTGPPSYTRLTNERQC